MKTLVAITGATLLASVCQAKSATIPAGTVLTVRTLNTVSSVDSPGTPVQAELEYPVVASGKPALPTGTYFKAEVITSRRLTASSDRLTVNLISVRVGGRDISVRTTGPRLLSNYVRVSNDVKISLAYDVVAAGKRMQFQLAQPLVF